MTVQGSFQLNCQVSRCAAGCPGKAARLRHWLPVSTLGCLPWKLRGKASVDLEWKVSMPDQGEEHYVHVCDSWSCPAGPSGLPSPRTESLRIPQQLSLNTAPAWWLLDPRIAPDPVQVQTGVTQRGSALVREDRTLPRPHPWVLGIFC